MLPIRSPTRVTSCLYVLTSGSAVLHLNFAPSKRLPFYFAHPLMQTFLYIHFDQTFLFEKSLMTTF